MAINSETVNEKRLIDLKKKQPKEYCICNWNLQMKLEFLTTHQYFAPGVKSSPVRVFGTNRK